MIDFVFFYKINPKIFHNVEILQLLLCAGVGLRVRFVWYSYLNEIPLPEDFIYEGSPF